MAGENELTVVAARKKASMSHISSINHSRGLDKHPGTTENGLEIHPESHHPTLDEIQLRAIRIHSQHGGVCGGYNLDDWFEAEHELEDENERSSKKDPVQ
jgi:hypothetical protein